MHLRLPLILMVSLIIALSSTSCVTLLTGVNQRVQVDVEPQDVSLYAESDEGEKIHFTANSKVKLRKKHEYTIHVQDKRFPDPEIAVNRDINPLMLIDLIPAPLAFGYSIYSLVNDNMLIGATLFYTWYATPAIPAGIDFATGASHRFPKRVAFRVYPKPLPLPSEQAFRLALGDIHMEGRGEQIGIIKKFPETIPVVLGPSQNTFGAQGISFTDDDLGALIVENGALHDILILDSLKVDEETGVVPPDLRYTLDLLVTDVEMETENRAKGQFDHTCTMKTSWMLNDRLTQTVVFDTTMVLEGSSYEESAPKAFREAMHHATVSFMNSNGLRQALVAKDHPNKLAYDHFPSDVRSTIIHRAEDGRTGEENAQPKRFEVKAGGGSCVAFPITADGHLLTSSLLVAGGGSVIVSDEDGNTMPAEVLMVDPESRVSVLKIEVKEPISILYQLDTEEGYVGTRFRLAGGDKDVGKFARYESSLGKDIYKILVENDVPPVGTPLLNANGNVVGMVAIPSKPDENGTPSAFACNSIAIAKSLNLPLK